MGLLDFEDGFDISEFRVALTFPMLTGVKSIS
jgi:hypothetical protein